MDAAATKAEFARNIVESQRILTMMRIESRLNCYAIDQSRKAIDDSRDMLDVSDGDANS